MNDMVRIIYAIASALCACLFVFHADKKVLDKRRDRKWLLLSEGMAFFTGAVCGWMLYMRIEDHYINAVRVMIAAGVLAGAAYCDLAERKIPNLYFIILLGDFLICSLLQGIMLKEQLVPLLVGGVISGVVIFLFFMLLRLISRGGIGYGDIKLFTGLGFAFGIYGCIYVLLIAQLAALAVVVVGLLMRKLTLKGAVPLAPFFYIGIIAVVALGTF